MRQRQVKLNADTPAAALASAARQLGVPEGELTLKRLTPNRFEAVLSRADAELEIKVSPDDLRAQVTGYAPPLGEGATLSRKAIDQALTEAGVGISPDEKAVAELIRRLAAGEEIRGLVLVEGQAPQPSTDDRLELAGDPRRPVFPGEIFARKINGEPALPGRGVSGRELAPPGPERPGVLKLEAGEGCAPVDGGLAVRSTLYGLPEAVGGRVRVQGLIEVAEDRLTAVATVYERGHVSSRPTPEQFRAALAALKIDAPLDEAALAKGLELAEQSGEAVQGVILARGVPPVAGLDGRFESDFSATAEIGRVGADGRIDFRERGLVKSVAAGRELGRIVPPTRGTPGRDVFGQPVPAEDGRPAAIVAGENVTVRDDGRMFAAREGMILFQPNLIGVTEVLQIEGDVDFHTGNIHADSGSIHIKGCIRDTFSVSAPGNVVVDDAIENAVVEAGGDVQVQRGIRMHQGGRIQCGGSLEAHFAVNAVIQAGGDVVVDNDLTNCQIDCQGTVQCFRGKGRIQGGQIRSGGGVVANEIGSEMGVATTIVLGRLSAALEELWHKRRESEAVVKKIDQRLGMADPRVILGRTPPAKRRAVAVIIKARINAARQVETLDQAIQQEQEAARRACRAAVKVYGVIHSGAVIHIGDSFLHVERTERTCRVRLDPAGARLRLEPLE